ncbi:phage tail protein [Paraburkholderia sp. C35]|uniref:phage tail protein n=1 Tax=Paraburkholderia sp. C35 TaxID=2126993 RepID=UPI00194FAA6B|nr:phage tail protein [Paraburkholderia sp. C35]
MMLYQFDPHSGQFVTARLADPDPLNANRWLVPAFCTEIPIPDRPRLTWPFWVDGAWVLQPDYRTIPLYQQSNGDPAEILMAGITPAQAGLTDKPRPSDEYKFDGDDWGIDATVVAARLRAAKMAEFDVRMERARAANFGKGDALISGVLSPGDRAVFQAWANYQMKCTAIIHAPEFPNVCDWPDEPDEAAVYAKGVADDAAEEKARQDAAQKTRDETQAAMDVAAAAMAKERGLIFSADEDPQAQAAAELAAQNAAASDGKAAS